jgi:hypothetical protein
MTVQSCMGGWCTKRQRCPNYHAATPGQRPEERLCLPGEDGIGIDQPVRLHSAAGTWEREPGLMAAAGIWDALG